MSSYDPEQPHEHYFSPSNSEFDKLNRQIERDILKHLSKRANAPSQNTTLDSDTDFTVVQDYDEHAQELLAHLDGVLKAFNAYAPCVINILQSKFDHVNSSHQGYFALPSGGYGKLASSLKQVLEAVNTAFDGLTIDNSTFPTRFPLALRMEKGPTNVLDGKLILSPISTLYTLAMLSHISPLANSSKLEKMNSDYPKLMEYAHICNNYLYLCSAYHEGVSFLEIPSFNLSRAMSLVGPPGTGKSHCLTTILATALFLQIPVDLGKGKDEVYEFRSFEINNGKRCVSRHIHPFSPQKDPKLQVSLLKSFIKKQSKLPPPRLCLVDPIEVDQDKLGKEHNPVSYFTLNISPLYISAPEVTDCPPFKDEDLLHTSTNRLISAHSCPQTFHKPYFYSLDGRKNSHKLHSYWPFAQHFTLPIPHYYSSKQLSKIFSGKLGIWEDHIKYYAADDLRSWLFFLQIKTKEEYRAFMKYYQQHQIKLNGTGGHRPSKDQSKDLVLSNSCSSGYDHILRDTISTSSQFVHAVLNSQQIDKGIPLPRGGTAEEDAFLKAAGK